MTHRDRTPIVLALAAEAIHLHACDHADDYADLSDGLALAVDHGAVANLWPPTGVDESAARWLASVLTGDADRDDREGDDALVVATAAARRLADVAASLAVRGDSHHREARALWDAASRLLGFEAEAEVEKPTQVNRATPAPSETKNPDHRPEDYSARLADGIKNPADFRFAAVLKENEVLRSERDDARREIERFAESHVRSQDTIAALRSDIGSQTREHAAEVARLAERIAALEADLNVMIAKRITTLEAEPSAVRVGPGIVTFEEQRNDNQPKRYPSPWHVIRLAVIHAGAKDFTVSYTGGRPAIVVDLGERIDISTVAKIIAEHGRAWGTYRIRAVGGDGWIEASRRKCQHREDGDDSACDHCSLKG